MVLSASLSRKSHCHCFSRLSYAAAVYLRGGVGLECDLTFSHIPKVLKGCLHTICQNCAEDRLQRSNDTSSIKCPMCGVLTSDVTTTSALQDNIMALQDLNRVNSHCDFCDDVVKASHACNECESLLCGFHVNAHAISRGTKLHHVVPLTDRASMLSIHGISHRVPITCARHNDVPAKLFCLEPCCTIMCHDCSAADHAGHTVCLADSEEVEVMHRTDLTQRAIALGHRYVKSCSPKRENISIQFSWQLLYVMQATATSMNLQISIRQARSCPSQLS